MTPTEACALLERHRDMWPEWMVKAQPSMGVLGIFAETPPIYLINLGDPKRRNGRVVYVRPGLPDEENVRRIIAAAEKGYRQRQRQVEKQRKKLKPVNRKRKAKRFAEDSGGKDHAEWGAMRPCDACARRAWPKTPNHNHHEPSRGAGGKAADQVTLCPGCHHAVHTLGAKTFEEEAEVNLRELAAKRYQEWLAQGGHELPSGLEIHGEAR